MTSELHVGYQLPKQERIVITAPDGATLVDAVRDSDGWRFALPGLSFVSPLTTIVAEKIALVLAKGVQADREPGTKKGAR